MIDMEYVDGFVVENLAIDGGGTAAVGVNVDRYGPGGNVNTTRWNLSANQCEREFQPNWEFKVGRSAVLDEAVE